MDAARGTGRGSGKGVMKRPAAATKASQPEGSAPEQPESSVPGTLPKKRARKNQPETKQEEEKEEDTKELQQSSKQQTDDQEDASIPKANNGKPGTKPKAKAESKPKSKSCKKEGKGKGTKESDPDQASKQTFARRNQPGTEVGLAKWSGLRRVFEEHVAPKLYYPSKFEELLRKQHDSRSHRLCHY